MEWPTASRHAERIMAGISDNDLILHVNAYYRVAESLMSDVIRTLAALTVCERTGLEFDNLMVLQVYNTAKTTSTPRFQCVPDLSPAEASRVAEEHRELLRRAGEWHAQMGEEANSHRLGVLAELFAEADAAEEALLDPDQRRIAADRAMAELIGEVVGSGSSAASAQNSTRMGRRNARNTSGKGTSREAAAGPSKQSTYFLDCCCVCWDEANKVDVIIVPCGHVALCNGCSKELRGDPPACPMCRGPIGSMYAILKS